MTLLEDLTEKVATMQAVLEYAAKRGASKSTRVRDDMPIMRLMSGHYAVYTPDHRHVILTCRYVADDFRSIFVAYDPTTDTVYYGRPE